MAAYYCALPAVSRTLTDALHDSKKFVDSIKEDPCAVLEAAARLHHRILFREALIWAVGNFTNPEFRHLSDRRLRQIAKCAYGEIATKDSSSTSRIIDLAVFGIGDHYSWSDELVAGFTAPNADINWDAQSQALSIRPPLNLPTIFRTTVSSNELRFNVSIEQLYLLAVLKNNLVLDRNQRVAGEGGEEDYFLSGEIEDEDLPWDLTEMDW